MSAWHSLTELYFHGQFLDGWITKCSTLPAAERGLPSKWRIKSGQQTSKMMSRASGNAKRVKRFYHLGWILQVPFGFSVFSPALGQIELGYDGISFFQKRVGGGRTISSGSPRGSCKQVRVDVIDGVPARLPWRHGTRAIFPGEPFHPIIFSYPPNFSSFVTPVGSERITSFGDLGQTEFWRFRSA